VILLGHVLAIAFPSIWLAVVARTPALMAVETAGIACTVLAIGGLVALLVRRATSGRLQPVSTVMDYAVAATLLAQLLLGLWVALAHRWGAAWGPAVLSPYLASLLSLRPDLAFVADMPGLVKLHIAGFWVLMLLVPFSRLVHIFALPFEYLWRLPQIVVWTNPRRFVGAEEQLAAVEDRRTFVKAGLGLGVGAVLLGVGTADKLGRYLKGATLEPEQEADLLKKKVDRLTQTAEQRALELERVQSPFIAVGRLSELGPKKGKYFIDYRMRPALAFLAGDGLPLLISAKCTHLGCTVGSDVDDQGRILCPCHVSHFDLRTGKPNDGAPAKEPLPRLGWIVKNAEGKTLVSESPSGKREGQASADDLRDAIVYIAQHFDDGADA